jgi:hypothetical protein
MRTQKEDVIGERARVVLLQQSGVEPSQRERVSFKGALAWRGVTLKSVPKMSMHE